MMSFLHDDDLLSGHLLASDSIALAPEQIDWAISLSRHAATEADQWQTYLNGLALLGLQDWLQKRSPELTLLSDWFAPRLTEASLAEASLAERAVSGTASIAESVSRVQVGAAQLYLLTTDGISDPWVAVPRHLFRSEAAQPDFYLLVEVLEELAEVRVQGYLPQASFQERLAQLQPELQSSHLEDPAESTEVLLPLQDFSIDPDALLLHLRTGFQLSSAQLSSVQLSSTQLSSVQTTPAQPTQAVPSPPRIHVGHWLNNQLDALATALSWVLLPPAEVDLSGALRSNDTSDLNLVIRNLKRDQALVIPTDARVAYRDVALEGLAARLYLLIWAAPDQAEWSLLLILGAQPDLPQPVGLRLLVEAAGEVLSNSQLHDPYLYVQVVGNRDEQFQVTLIAPNGNSLLLSVFAL